MSKILSSDQIEGFRRDGYVAPIRVISKERAAEIRHRLEDIEKSTGESLRVALKVRPHLLFTWMNNLIREERILDAVEDVYGENLLCWSSEFFVKEPNDPSFVSWHQDSTYWGLSSPDVVTAWLALSVSNKENGALEVIPGTHLYDQLPHRDTFAQANMLSRGQEIAVDVGTASAVTIELEPGEMSLHHVRIVHGSAANRSATERRIGFAIRYIPTYVRQVSGKAAASLVRGIDNYRTFVHEPIPTCDGDSECVAFREKAGEWWSMRNQTM